MSEQWEKQLQEAVQKLALPKESRERILNNCNFQKKPVCIAGRTVKTAVALCLILILTLLSPRLHLWDNKEGVLVYASTEDGEWNRLKIGERQRLIRVHDKGKEQCVLFLQMPRGYLFESEGVKIGEDYIRIAKGRIYWTHYDENEKVDGKASLRLVFTDSDGNRVGTEDALELILSREEGECYAQLRRIQ